MIIALSRDRRFIKLCTDTFAPQQVLSAVSFIELMSVREPMPEDIVLADITNVGPFDITKLKCNVLVLTDVPKFNEAITLMRYGIRGYGNRAMHTENLRQAVSSVASGQVWMPPFIISKLITSLPDEEPQEEGLTDLSDRELQVARHVAAGLTNREIAEEMGITVRTVKAHLTSIFNKTGLRDRVALAIRFKGQTV